MFNSKELFHDRKEARFRRSPDQAPARTSQESGRRGSGAVSHDARERSPHAGIKPETIQVPKEKSSECTIPKLDMRAACGFPAPASEVETEETDLYDLLVPKPGKTILVEASGDSMVDAGIFEGDLLIVEVSSEARSGQIVLVCYDGNFLVKRLKVIDGRPELRSENSAVRYPVLRPRTTEQFVIEGIVRHVIRSYR